MADIAKASVQTLLGPEGASVTKASIQTLLGPGGASVSKVSIQTLLTDVLVEHVATVAIGQVFTGQSLNASALRKANMNSAAQSGSVLGSAQGQAAEMIDVVTTGSEIDGLGGTEMLTQTLVGSTLYGESFEALRGRQFHGYSLAAPVSLEASTFTALALISSQKLEIRSAIGYSLIGPPQIYSRTPIKGPPRVEATPVKPGLVATKIDLPAPPQEWSADWARTLQETMIAQLSKLQKAEEANASTLLRSAGGKVYEITVDDDGNITATYRQG